MNNINVADLLLPLTIIHLNNASKIQNGQPDYGYGTRHGSNDPKGQGYFGGITTDKELDGYSTEISIPSKDNSKEIPQIVPSNIHRELVDLLSGNNQMRQAIVTKADQNEAMRKLEGKNAFAGPQDKKSLVPLPIPENSLIIDLISSLIGQ